MRQAPNSKSMNMHLLPTGPQGHVFPQNPRSYRMGKTQDRKSVV